MKNLLGVVLLFGVLVVVASCGGGGSSGSTSTGGTYFTYPELADEFVYRMNVDAGYDITLIKTYTDQSNYIVVYDHDLDTYDSYYIGAYNVGEDLDRYLVNYDDDFYYNLDIIGENHYEDYFSGITFDETSVSPKDLEKMGAVMEQVRLEKVSTYISAEYGLSESRSLQIAKLATAWSNTSKSRSMTDADANSFSEELVGFSLTKATAAFKKSAEGDSVEMTSLIEQAAELNGTTPEQMNNIISDMFIK